MGEGFDLCMAVGDSLWLCLEGTKKYYMTRHLKSFFLGLDSLTPSAQTCRFLHSLNYKINVTVDRPGLLVHSQVYTHKELLHMVILRTQVLRGWPRIWAPRLGID